MRSHCEAIKYVPNGEYPQTFAEAAALFSANKRKDGRIAANTFLTAKGADYGVTLYQTEIIRFYADGRVRLESGGYQTATTRARMGALGVRIGTTQGVAAVTHGGREWTFSDGMVLLPDGDVRYWRPTDPDPERVRRRRVRNRRRGGYVPCEGRQSSHWSGGNVPEAFELDGETPRHCYKCRGNGYVGIIGRSACFCPECGGKGLIEEVSILATGVVSWDATGERYFWLKAMGSDFAPAA